MRRLLPPLSAVAFVAMLIILGLAAPCSAGKSAVAGFVASSLEGSTGPAAPYEAPAPLSAEARSALLDGYAAEIRRMLAAGKLPIIDVEHHWGGKIKLERLLALMDQWDVALTWLGANERNGSASSTMEARKFPTRIVATTIHGDGPRWHGRDMTLMDELEADARTGAFFAMGEFEARHYVSSTNSRDVHLPMDSAMFARVLAIAEATGLPLLVHHEAEDRLLPELERALVAHPRAKVVWCHVGRNRDRATWTVLPRPDGVRAMLRAHHNLYFDLNQAKPGSRHRGTNEVDSVLFDTDPRKGGHQPDARLKEEWRELFEEYSDRFVIGSDINTGRFENYGQVMGMMRSKVLARLSRPAAENIAFRNAWRLMSGSPWRD